VSLPELYAASALGAVVLVWLALRRANELCVVRLSRGRARLVRGRAPARLLGDLAEIARRSPSAEGLVRVVLDAGSPRARLPGAFPAAVAQQVRNVVGQHSTLHFRSGRRP
jgi:hypothetical protein